MRQQPCHRGSERRHDDDQSLVSGTGQTNFAITPVNGSRTIGRGDTDCVDGQCAGQCDLREHGTASLTGGSGAARSHSAPARRPGCSVDGSREWISVA